MSKRVMFTINKSGTYTVWFVPFNNSKGADYAEGDCSFITFKTKDEALIYMKGYNTGLVAS